MKNEIIERFKSESPKFFKRLTNIMIGIGAIGTLIITAPISLPATLVTIGGYATVIGATGATVSKLTKK
jgi:hypothetical protein